MRILDNLSRSMYAVKTDMSNFGKKAWTYLKTGSAYHVASLVTFPTIVGPVYSQYLAVGRYREYKEIRADLEKFGYDEERIRPRLTPWWCPRHAAGLAARELGFEREFNGTLKKYGIKWYHIGPKNPVKWVKTETNIGILQGIGRMLKRH